MIFVTNAAGQCIHISSDWTRLTGQDAADALDYGFFECIHPEDREIIKSARDQAAKTAAEYTLRYRLRKPDGTYRWVGAGGLPSFGMDNSFIGYMGSITELAEGAIDTITAYGNVEQFIPPTPHLNTMPSCKLDLVADYLILAHSLIEQDGGKDALPGLRAALFEVGRALAARSLKSKRPIN